MFLENRDALLSCYMDTFHLLRQRYKNLTMVLIGRGENLPATPMVLFRQVIFQTGRHFSTAQNFWCLRLDGLPQPR